MDAYIGFSADLSTLAALVEDRHASNNAILAPAKTDKNLSELIDSLRAEGEVVIRQLNVDSDPALLGCNRKLEKLGDDWIVVEL